MPSRKRSQCEQVDPKESAVQAGLRYVTYGGPGITRKRSGKGLTYFGVEGKPLKDEQHL